MGERIKYVRGYNEDTYMPNLLDICRDNRIIDQLTIIYTSQQNWIVERRNGTLNKDFSMYDDPSEVVNSTA